MDWERVKHVVSSQQQFPFSQSDATFLDQFLKELHQRLQDCASVKDCAKNYPEAGPVLTCLATHPYIALEYARPVVACLFEYVKLLTATAHSKPLDDHDRASLWALQRLRRLTHTPEATSLEHEATALIARLDQKCSGKILNPTQVQKLLDKSLALLAFPESYAVIERIVLCALDLVKPISDSGYGGAGEDLEETEYYMEIPVFPSHFWNDLLNKNSRLWSCYMQWQPSIKARLWTVKDALVKGELEDMLFQCCADTSYQPPSQLRDTLRQTPLVQTIMECPWAFSSLLETLAQMILVRHDWRIIRISQSLHDLVLREPELVRFPGALQSSARLLQDTSTDPKDVQAKLAEHVYGGAMDGLGARQIEAWWLTLLYPNFVYRCACNLMKWCATSNVDWDTELEACCRYLVWMTCPSDDERTQMAFEDMVDWLKWLRKAWTQEDFAQVAHRFSWCQSVCNGNVVVAQALLLAALTYLSEWKENDWKALMDAGLRGTTGRPSPALIYFVLDHLHNITSSSPSSLPSEVRVADFHSLLEHVYTLFPPSS